MKQLLGIQDALLENISAGADNKYSNDVIKVGGLLITCNGKRKRTIDDEIRF